MLRRKVSVRAPPWGDQLTPDVPTWRIGLGASQARRLTGAPYGPGGYSRPGGCPRYSSPIWKLASEAAPLHGSAPMLGEHNGYVLGEVLGYPPERLGSLERDEVIGEVPLEGADMGGVRRGRRQQS